MGSIHFQRFNQKGGQTKRREDKHKIDKAEKKSNNNGIKEKTTDTHSVKHTCIELYTHVLNLYSRCMAYLDYSLPLDFAAI